VFYNALGYVVEQGHLASNPVDRIQWTTPAVAQSVDRRVVVSPAQARALLAAVQGLSDRGAHLEAFYACLYYAALRPSEAVILRESDLHLPKKGWGRIDLAASASRAGTAWTDHGTARQERGLKHRAAHETRTIPIPPGAASSRTRPTAPYGPTPAPRPSPPRNAGHRWAAAPTTCGTRRCRYGSTPVPATEVARRAGHGVAVLLKVYAHCIDGQADAANQRITDALSTPRGRARPGEEGDADSEPAA
jgi:integrase